MKVGDVAFCVKSRTKNNTKGKLYKIMDVTSDIIVSDDTKNKTGTHYDSSDDSETYFTFNEHFLNVREYRKLKLEKINDRR